jgi:hypothetical protein
MEYQIVTADSAGELERKVNEFLQDKWVPVGGVSVVRYEITNERKGYTESEWEYSQAMTKAG